LKRKTHTKQAYFLLNSLIENVLTDCQSSNNLKCCWLKWLLTSYCLIRC